MPAYTLNIDDTVTLAETFSTLIPRLAVTDSVRASASSQLRLLRHPLLYVHNDLPPVYGDLEPGDTIYSDHELLPGLQPGVEAWRLVPLFVVSVTDHVKPPKISLKCLDLRLVYCTWWSPLRTDIGMTDDLNGIAIIDQAGGWATSRAQIAYGERPGDDETFQAVAVHTPIIDAFGLLIQGGGDTNLLLNSTFSEGAGDVFASWTKTTSGAAIAVSWGLYTLIDATGFRRACQLATYATGEASYLSQTVAAVGGKILYARVFYKNGGATDDLEIRIQRSDDSRYWRDSDGSWQVAVTSNPITPKTGVVDSLRWISKQLDLTGATTNLTISVGHFSAAYNAGQITQLQGVELIEIADGPFERWRGPLPTKAAAVTRVASYTHIVNDTAVRVLSPTRGLVKLDYTPLWDHSDLADGAIKYISSADFDGASNLEWLRCYYKRIDAATAHWIFENPDSGQAIAVGPLVERDATHNVICRWTSESDDEHGLVGQALEIWIDGVLGATVSVGQVTQNADSACNVYVGSTPNDGAETIADAHFTNVTISDHCPNESELLRY